MKVIPVHPRRGSPATLGRSWSEEGNKDPAGESEAIELAEGSKLLKKALGDHVFDSFIKNKKIEWDLSRTAVTDFELKRYLPLLQA